MTISYLDYHQVEIYILLAIILKEEGKIEDGEKYFERAILIANLQACIRPFIEAENIIIPLY